MDVILGYLWGVSAVAFGALLTFVGLVASPFGQLWKNDADRKRAVGNLIQSGWRKTYTRLMTRWLDALDAWLSQDETERGLGPARRAFSHGLIQATMLLAAAYPILSLAAQWIAGSPMSLGDAPLAEAGSAGQRAFVAVWIILIIVLIGLFVRAERNQSQARWPLLMSVLGTVLGGMYLAGRLYIPSPVAVAVAFAFAFAVAGAVAFAFAFAGAFALAFAFAVVGAGGVAVAVAGAVAGAGAGAFAFALAFAVDRYNRGKSPLWWVGFLVILLFALTATILLRDRIADAPLASMDAMVFAFLGAFPIFNALADFASIGLTRYLLRRGLSGASWRTALADLLGGGAIFAALGLSLVTWLHLVRLPDGAALLDLPGLFGGLRTTPGDYWWLFFMLFSTLIPTLLHGMVAVFTLLIEYPVVLRRWVHDRLVAGGEGSDVLGWQGALGYCAMITLSIWLPLAALALVMSLDHGAVLGWIVDRFAAYHGWLAGVFPR